MAAADEARRAWKAQGVPMEQRRPQLLKALNRLYERRNRGTARPVALVSLVGAGPGDPELWTLRAVQRVRSGPRALRRLVDVAALRRVTRARCFAVGKRARRDSVPQETIHRLMIRAAKQGKRVVRLKGGDPFVFGRGGEEALALAMAGVSFEVVPG